MNLVELEAYKTSFRVKPKVLEPVNSRSIASNSILVQIGSVCSLGLR